MLKNDTFLRALLKEPVDYTPVWMMRQAGRYLPEYRRIREQAGSFLDLCKNTDLATEVALQPLARFDLDAAILFSDILTIPDAMGLGLYFVEGEGPKFAHPLQTEAAIKRLEVPDMDKLRYVTDAVRSIRKALNGQVPLIGFSGSPFTLACYMVEGGSSRDFATIKTMMYRRPDLVHQILQKNTLAVIDYLNAQILAGAQAIQIFDSWGGVLTPAAYETFSLQYMAQIVQNLIREHDGRKVPVIVFTKGGGLWLEKIATIGTDAVGLDWSCDIGQARAQIGHQCALQGNLDPAILFGSPETIVAETRRILDAYGSGTGHVFNLGHGINQFASPENAKVFIDAVHHLSKGYHEQNPSKNRCV